MLFDTNAWYDDDFYGYYKQRIDAAPDEIICGKIVKISKITESIEDGSVSYELSFTFNKKVKKIVVSRDILMSPKMFDELTLQGADVTSSTSKYLIDVLRQQQEAIEKGNKIVLSYKNLGWIKYTIKKKKKTIEKLFYRSYKLIGCDLPAEYIGDYDVEPSGSFDAYRETLKNEIIGHTPLELIVLAGMSAVINGLISPNTTEENPIFHLNCGSGTGKSTAGQAAVATTGQPFSGQKTYTRKGKTQKLQSLYSTWGTTKNASISRFKGNNGAIIVLNELGKYPGQDMSGIVYNLSEGTDKERLNQDLQTQISEVYHTTFVSIGETSLIEHCNSKMEGIGVRVLEIDQTLTTDAAHADRIKESSRQNYGFAAPMIAEYIINNGGEQYVCDIFNENKIRYTPLFPDTPQRERFVTKFVALIMTTAQIASKALCVQFDADGLLNYFIEYDKRNGGKRATALDSYDYILNECRSHINSLYSQNCKSPSPEILGKIDYPKNKVMNGRKVIEEYSIYKKAVEKILKANGFENAKTCARA